VNEQNVPGGGDPEHEKRIKAGNDILAILESQTKSPGEALLLIQQLTIFIWNHYQLDWQGTPDSPLAANRKQRYLDFISQLIDSTGYQEEGKTAS
jgi:hypothetical protein